jgi:hypothetical protein
MDPRRGEDKKSAVSGIFIHILTVFGIFIRILTERDLCISLGQVRTKGAQSPTPSSIVRGAAGLKTGEEGVGWGESSIQHLLPYSFSWGGGELQTRRPNSLTKSRLKSQEFSSLLFTVTSTAVPRDFYFFKLMQPLTVFRVQFLYTAKEKGGKPDRKPYPLFLWFKKSIQKPQI